METVTQHDEHIYQIKVPLPFPLRWVNGYIIRGNYGLTVIDPGLHTEDSEKVWQDAVTRIGCRFADVEQIVLTHHHPDHYGLAGWLQEKSGAPVRMSQVGHAHAVRLWGEGQTMSEQVMTFFVQHGMDDRTRQQMLPHLDSFMPLVAPHPKVEFIRGQDRIRLGDREYAAIVTPGHASGHLCFYDQEREELFCGDHVLPQISPNVSYLPGEGSDPNPLQSFLVSLDEVAGMSVKKAYPGHREPFTTFSERAREIILHHEERLSIMKQHLNQPLTAFEVCMQVFGERLSIHQLRFALSETLAHLIYLRDEGQVKQLDRDSTICFVHVAH